jgi:hypothetical protein
VSINVECPECGFHVDYKVDRQCPKCDCLIRDQSVLGLYEIDVAHNNETVEIAEKKISDAVDFASYRGFSGVKVIHGYGSKSGKSIISGPAVHMMKRLARKYGGKFTKDQGNVGASIIWFSLK